MKVAGTRVNAQSFRVSGENSWRGRVTGQYFRRRVGVLRQAYAVAACRKRAQSSRFSASYILPFRDNSTTLTTHRCYIFFERGKRRLSNILFCVFSRILQTQHIPEK